MATSQLSSAAINMGIKRKSSDEVAREIQTVLFAPGMFRHYKFIYQWCCMGIDCLWTLRRIQYMLQSNSPRCILYSQTSMVYSSVDPLNCHLTFNLPPIQRSLRFCCGLSHFWGSVVQSVNNRWTPHKLIIELPPTSNDLSWLKLCRTGDSSLCHLTKNGSSLGHLINDNLIV